MVLYYQALKSPKKAVLARLVGNLLVEGGKMNTNDIAARLEAAGFSDFFINYERGIAIVFFKEAKKEVPYDEQKKS